MRVAFGEGWGNAFSGMAGGDSVYRDSMGATQSQTFKFDVEDNQGFAKGWFNERSIHSVLYDIFDSNNDGVDTVSLGFKPILAALHSSDYINFPGLTSIYPAIELIKRANPQAETAISALMQNQAIYGTGMYGAAKPMIRVTALCCPFTSNYRLALAKKCAVIIIGKKPMERMYAAIYW